MHVLIALAFAGASLSSAVGEPTALFSGVGITGNEAIARAKKALRTLDLGGDFQLQQIVKLPASEGREAAWSVQIASGGTPYYCHLRELDGKVLAVFRTQNMKKVKALPRAQLKRKVEQIVDTFRGDTPITLIVFHVGSSVAWAHYRVTAHGLEIFNGGMTYSVFVDAATGSLTRFTSASDLPRTLPPPGRHLSLAQAEKLLEKYQATVPPPTQDSRTVFTPILPHHGLKLGYMFDEHKTIRLVWWGHFSFPSKFGGSKMIAAQSVVLDAKSGNWLKQVRL